MVERRGVTTCLIMLASVLALAWLYLTAPAAQRQTPEESVPLVDVIPVRWQSLALPVVAEGLVQPAQQITLVARVSGTVVMSDDQFRDGGVVEAEHALLRLDDEPYRLALAQQRHDTSAARLHLAETRARAQVARRTSGANAAPYALLQPHLEEAEARLAAAEAALRNATLQLEYTRLAAPFAGRLKDVAVHTGQYVNAGERLATLYGTQRMEVRLPVRDRWLSLISQDGAAVTVRGRFAGREAEWPGRIVRREGGLNENRMVYLVAEVMAGEGMPAPEPGLLVQADIEGRTLTNVMRLPRSVLGADGRLWSLDEQHRLRRHAMTPLYQDAQWVYFAADLAEGTPIVREGGLRWLEGSRALARLPDNAGNLAGGTP